MAGSFPRRQAAVLGELLSVHCVPGLLSIEAPARHGKSDLLWQLFEQLRSRPKISAALLRLGHQPMTAAACEEAVSQLLAPADGRTPGVNSVDRDRLAEQGNGELWLEFLESMSRDSAFSARRFFSGLAQIAEVTGPICLLLDDAAQDCVDAAAAIAGRARLAIVLTSRATLPDGARVIRLEPLTLRESVLLAESRARAMGVDFNGAEAESFIAYTRNDPFVIDSVVGAAAAHGVALKTADAFARCYQSELSHGTLAAYFRSRGPGEPGTPQRRFALELLASGAEDALLARWKRRITTVDVLREMESVGWVKAGGTGWIVEDWPAARDWAAAELAGPEMAGPMLLRLLADVDAAGIAAARSRLEARIISGLRALTPDAGAWLAERGARGFSVPEVVHVDCMAAGARQFFFCYGFREGIRKKEAESALAIAFGLETDGTFPAPAGKIPPVPVVEKWVVLKNASFAEQKLAEEAGARALDFELFNELVTRPLRTAAPEDEGTWDVDLKLPIAPDIELAAVDVLDRLLERHRWPERESSQARMALIEACLNAIEHSRATQLNVADARIEIRLNASEAALRVAVWNPGAPFPSEAEETEATPGSSLHRGHGLKMIRSVMDEVSFSSDLNGTTLHMGKRILLVRTANTVVATAADPDAGNNRGLES